MGISTAFVYPAWSSLPFEDDRCCPDALSTAVSDYMGVVRLTVAKLVTTDRPGLASNEKHGGIELGISRVTLLVERSEYFGLAGCVSLLPEVTVADDEGCLSLLGESGCPPPWNIIGCGTNHPGVLEKMVEAYSVLDAPIAGDLGHADVIGHAHTIGWYLDTASLGGANSHLVELECASRIYLVAVDAAATGALYFMTGEESKVSAASWYFVEADGGEPTEPR